MNTLELDNDDSSIYNDEELSTYNLPPEVKLNFVLRYCYKIQRLLDLKTDELEHLYSLYEDFKSKEFRNNELNNQNAELRRTIKALHASNNELNLKLLSSKRK